MYYDDLKLEPITSECGDGLNFDLDADGLTLLEEYLGGTDPCNPDTDFDGHPDGVDNCPLEFNPDQLDSNENGVGDVCEPEPACEADIDGSGVIDVQDLVLVILDWGPCPPPCGSDVNGDGMVDVQDMVMVILAWGACF